MEMDMDMNMRHCQYDLIMRTYSVIVNFYGVMLIQNEVTVKCNYMKQDQETSTRKVYKIKKKKKERKRKTLQSERALTVSG